MLALISINVAVLESKYIFQLLSRANSGVSKHCTELGAKDCSPKILLGSKI